MVAVNPPFVIPASVIFGMSSRCGVPPGAGEAGGVLPVIRLFRSRTAAHGEPVLIRRESRADPAVIRAISAAAFGPSYVPSLRGPFAYPDPFNCLP